MDSDVQKALSADRVVDITTTGRFSGEPHKVEIWFHNVDGGIYITGTPGPRSWYANLLGNAALTFHLKESVQLDLAGMAIPVVDEERRRKILGEITQRVAPTADLDEWVAASPLVEVRL